MAENDTIFRINCAGTGYADGSGQIWLGDGERDSREGWKVEGGRAIVRAGATISGTEDPELFRSYREGDFRYSFQVPEGIYDVVLHFAESDEAVGASKRRTFNVFACDRPYLAGLDPRQSFGFLTAGRIELAGVKVEAKEELTVEIRRWTMPGFVNAIEVSPSASGTQENPGIGAGAIEELRKSLAAERRKGVSHDLSRAGEIGFPVRLRACGEAGAHRASFRTTCGSGFQELALTVGTAEAGTRFRVCFDGCEIAENATYHETRGKRRREEITYRYILAVPFAGEHEIEVSAHRWDERGEVEIRGLALSEIPREALAQRGEERSAGEAWGWSHVLTDYLSEVENIDYAQWRTVAEPWRWGANFVQMYSPTSEGRFRVPQEEPFTEIAHQYGFLAGIHGQGIAGEGGYSFEATLTTAMEWAKDSSNVGEKRPARAVDAWAAEEKGIGPGPGGLSDGGNLTRLERTMWDYNPGLAVAEVAGVVGASGRSRDTLHEGIHPWIRIIKSEDAVGPGGFDDVHRAELLPDHVGLCNEYGRVFEVLLGDCRYYAADIEGGPAGPDWVIKQCNDWFRTRARDGGESGLIWAAQGELGLPERLREGVYAVSMDPIRAAVTAPLETTGLGGRFHWVGEALAERGEAELGAEEAYRERERFPATALAIGNNHWRVIRYGTGDGGVLQADPTGLADFDANSAAVRIGRSFGRTRPTEAQSERIAAAKDIAVEAGARATIEVELETGVYEIEIEGDAANGPGAVVKMDGLALGTLDREQMRSKTHFPAVAASEGKHEIEIEARSRVTVRAMGLCRIGEGAGEVARQEPKTLRLAAAGKGNRYYHIEDEISSTGMNLGGVTLGADLAPGRYLAALRMRGMGKVELRLDEERFHERMRWKARAGCFATKETSTERLATIDIHEGGEHELALRCLAGEVDVERISILRFPVAQAKMSAGGHVIEVEETVTHEFGTEELRERKRWKGTRDSRILALAIEREWDGLAKDLALSLGAEHAGKVLVDGAEVSGEAAVAAGNVVSVPGDRVYPTMHFVLRELAEGKVAMCEGALALLTPARQSEEISIDIVTGSEVGPDEARAWSEALVQDEPELLFADVRHAEVAGPEGASVIRAVRVLEPNGGPYFVREDGWWVVRGAQPHAPAEEMEGYYEAYEKWRDKAGRGEMPMRPVEWDYLTVRTGGGKPAAVQPYGFIDGHARPGRGSQRQLALSEVTEGGCLAKVRGATALLFAPSVEFRNAFERAALDGESWAYFDENAVMLPNRAGTYSVTVEPGTGKRAAYLARTAASVANARWDEESRTLAIVTELPEYMSAAPEGTEFRALVRFDSNRLRFVSIEGAELVRRVAAAIIIRFQPQATVTCHFGTFEEEKPEGEEAEEAGAASGQGQAGSEGQIKKSGS
ncbi:MAG: malectin domain-containing carbohydrate-binding protein [Planctomycetota bacterium]